MRSILLITLVGLFSATAINAEDYVSKVRKGNAALKTGDYKTALECYHDAETEIPESAELDYNIAGALHGQGNYEQAVEKYNRAMKTTDAGLESNANYNLGNTYFRMKDFEKAIKSYEDALKANPKDQDAKFNLELARKKLKEQIKPQQQNKQDQKDKQDQKQQEQQDQKKQDQNKQDQKQQQQQDQQNQQDKQNQQNQQDKQDQKDKSRQQAQKNAKQMSKEDAERILNALRDDEKDIQKKIKRETVKGDYVGKDW